MPYSTQRKAHWVRLNHQNRVPKRWVAFDTEAVRSVVPNGEVQTWKLGAAKRWRTDLKRGDGSESRVFESPEELWRWVTDFCRPEQRTVVFAHNLGYDVRISRAVELLPLLGWRLEWCNLASTVSSMTWRSDRGTLVLADTFTWVPTSLDELGTMVGTPKLQMPEDSAPQEEWETYCLQDVEVVYQVVRQLVEFIHSEDLGNWQPTGAGMSYSVWRHKFMTHKVLVHDDETALSAERAAMHTGRAEAWRHGTPEEGPWYEADLRQAYTRIAAEYELPTKLKWHQGVLSQHQYKRLRGQYSVLARVEVRTRVPSVPCNAGGREIWAIGTFTSWLWDPEIDVALATADSVRITDSYIYTKHPILREWAQWVLEVSSGNAGTTPQVVRKWVKHSGRTLIGRISLRTSNWDTWGSNPDGESGISYQVDAESNTVSRMMHVGDTTFIESSRSEGSDSLPQVTGYIMSACRVQLWHAMCAAGLDGIAHVDTDSLLVDESALGRLRAWLGGDFERLWTVKAEYASVTVYGPRNYRGDSVRKTSGVPRGAVETAPNVFVGEKWTSMAGDMSAGRTDSVTVDVHEWRLNVEDPRRADAPGGRTRTAPVVVGQISNSSSDVVTTEISGS